MTTAWRAVEWTIVIVFGLTALLVLGGLTKLWFFDNNASLPFLGLLVTALIAEAISAAFVMFKSAMRYRPKTQRCKDPQAFEKFIEKFVSEASSVQITTNRLSWVSGSKRMQEMFAQLRAKGKDIQIVTSQVADCAQMLASAGVNISAMPTGTPSPEARFTLINGGRAAAEQLAIAVGSFPEHIVYIFDNKSGPQIIALAKDAFRLAFERARETEDVSA